MPAAKQYVVLHPVTVRISEETGEEKRFKPGDTYDGPDKFIPGFLAGVDFHGPLIAEKSAPQAADPNKE